MLRIGAIVLKVSDTERASSFWGRALNYEPRLGNPDFVRSGDGSAPEIHVDADDRTHLDLWTDSVAEQRAEVDRLVALGATEVDWDYPDDADFVVLADPDGTLFCIIDTSA